jgi:hypothetical protein
MDHVSLFLHASLLDLLSEARANEKVLQIDESKVLADEMSGNGYGQLKIVLQTKRGWLDRKAI